MSNYIVRRSHQRSRPTGLAGFFSDLVGADRVESEQCRAAADEKTAQLDAKTNDLARNWNPSGFYTLAQVRDLVKYTRSVLLSAMQTVSSMQAENSNLEATRTQLKQLYTDCTRKFDESHAYLAAATTAEKQGIGVIDSPGMKRWVTYSMTAASGAISGVAYIGCMKPWWLSAFLAANGAFIQLVSVAKAIVGVAISLGTAVLKIPDTIGTIWTYAKWAAVLGGAWVAYEHGPAFVKGLRK